ncbi:MAG: hypothetical protein JWN85_3640 [Gammaproteobacteria bacterium]|nr:hypothetical protein [Gammaproteobacteria bacterium]
MTRLIPVFRVHYVEAFKPFFVNALSITPSAASAASSPLAISSVLCAFERISRAEVRVFWKKLASSRLSAEVRIALKLILRFFNHTIDDVAEIYDRYAYAEENRAALQRLEDNLRRIARPKHKVWPSIVSERMRAAG